jgi:small subunit ribosomal protein S14
MAKKSSIEKQKKRELLVAKAHVKREALKEAIRSPKSSDEERLKAIEALNKMKRDTSPCRLRNRCQLTGRARAYLRRFKVSRLCFREMASAGQIPGIIKASW